MRKQEKEIPVFVFMGFLECGKTQFCSETLVDRNFTEGEPTLLIVTEEGIEEYDEKELEKRNISVVYLDEDFPSKNVFDFKKSALLYYFPQNQKFFQSFRK